MGQRLAVATVIATVVSLVPTPAPSVGVASASAGARPGEVELCFGAEATMVGRRGQNVIHGTPGDDVIVGHGAVKIYGHRGHDRICNDIFGRVDDESSPSPFIYGGLGRDKLLGNYTTDGSHLPFFLMGEGGGDRLRGGSQLVGGSGDDTLISTGENPGVSLSDGPGDDVVRGGPTHDHFTVGPGANTIIGSAPGCSGSFCDFVALQHARVVDLQAGYVQTAQSRTTLENIHMVVVSVHGSHTVTLRGSDTADLLSGCCIPTESTAPLVITGGQGNDRLSGGADDDRLFGNRGDDRLSGRAGQDQLTGGPGEDTLDGGPGQQDRCDDLGATTFRRCEQLRRIA